MNSFLFTEKLQWTTWSIIYRERDFAKKPIVVWLRPQGRGAGGNTKPLEPMATFRNKNTRWCLRLDNSLFLLQKINPPTSPKNYHIQSMRRRVLLCPLYNINDGRRASFLYSASMWVYHCRSSDQPGIICICLCFYHACESDSFPLNWTRCVFLVVYAFCAHVFVCAHRFAVLLCGGGRLYYPICEHTVRYGTFRRCLCDVWLREHWAEARATAICANVRLAWTFRVWR